MNLAPDARPVVTNLDLTEEQQMIRETVRRYAEEVIAAKARECDETSTFDMEAWKGMCELGLAGLPFPEEWGGAGLDNLAYMIAVEEVARVSGSMGLSYAAHVSLGTYPIYAWGRQPLKERYLRGLCTGEYMGAYGLTEPNAGSDSGATQTTAVRDGGGYVLNGRKSFVTNGNYARTFVCTAQTDRARGVKGIIALVVDREFPGVHVEPGEKKLGTRGSDWCNLAFQDCRVPEDHVLGPPGEGFGTFMKTLEGGRVSIGALAVGIAQGAYEQALRYSVEREQFGVPLADHQAVAFKLADMATEIAAARHLVWHAARLKDAGRPYGTEASMAKYYASEMAMRVTYDAIQVLGGNGYSREYPLQRMYRDAKLCTIGEGTSEVQKLIIARSILRPLRGK